MPKTLKSEETGLLVKKAVEGDKDAFNALTSLVHRQGRDYCLKILHDPDDVEDAIQMTLMKVLSYRGNIDPRRGGCWLLCVLRNCCRDLRRHLSTRRRYESETRADEAASWIPAPGEYSPLEQMCRQEMFQQASLAVSKLRAPYQKIFESVGLLGQTYGECATQENIPEGTVKSRLNHARKLLKQSKEIKGALQ